VFKLSGKAMTLIIIRELSGTTMPKFIIRELSTN